jgi:DNA-binding NarL/FixJ family response regulator
MSGKITLLVAEPVYLVRKGLTSFIADHVDFELVESVSAVPDLLQAMSLHLPDVLITDPKQFSEGVHLLRRIRAEFPLTGILIISDPANPAEITAALDSGATSFLLKECDEGEITEAIYHTSRHKSFLCGKILERLTFPRQESHLQTEGACNGLNVTEREIEIIRHVAEGLSNKEIAEKLFLSPHTINTHRKNIMHKLQINNTAGLVLFAVRNDILGPNKFLFS